MKKLYSLFAVAILAANVQAQTIKTVAITVSTIGTKVLGTGTYNNGAERTWKTDGISLGGKAITGNNTNTPTNGTAVNTVIQAQANNGVIYNTAALPGKIISITINSVGTPQTSTLYGGTSRLVNATAADYNVTGGTQVGNPATSGWTSADLSGTNYNFFAIKRGASVGYISSIIVEYLDPTILAVGNANSSKANLVKNTVVENTLTFASRFDARIINMNGQVVKNAEAKPGTSIDVSSLEKGVYLVAGNINGKMVSQKIIKK